MGNFQQWFNKTYNTIKETNMTIKCPKCGTVIPKDNEEDNPFERNEAYIEHRKEFPYYPDKHKEDEGTRRGRETAEYLKSLGYMGGKKDKEIKKEEQGVITAPMMDME